MSHLALQLSILCQSYQLAKLPMCIYYPHHKKRGTIASNDYAYREIRETSICKIYILTMRIIIKYANNKYPCKN